MQSIDPVTGATGAGFGFTALSLGEAKGVRDIGSALVVLVLLWAGQRRALGAALLAFAFIPTCDAAIVLLNGGAPAIAFGIHATTACLLLVLAGVLLWQPSRQGEVGANARVTPTSHLTSGGLLTNVESRSDIQLHPDSTRT